MNENENILFLLNDLFNTMKERKEESDAELRREKDDFEEGRNLAYLEMIEMLETRAKIYEVKLDE